MTGVMTRANLIFTHGAVFAVGIAAAMVANQMREGDSSSHSSSTSSVSRSSRAAGGGASSRGEAGAAADGRTRPGEGRSRTFKDPAELSDKLDSLVRITDPTERQRALMDLIEKLGPDQFASVMDQYNDLDHLGDSRGEYALLLRGWAKADPLAAIEYAQSHPGSQYTSGTILSTWAGQDPAAAERWALANYDGDGANPYLPAVIRGLAAIDLGEASRIAQSMPLSRERGDAVESITRALLQQGPEAAMAFPASIQDEALRGGFVSAIAERMVGKDPDKTAAWIASIQEGDEQLASTDTDKAATWVKTLQPEARAEAARGVIPSMSGNDIAATARWVSTLVGTPGYDGVVEEFVWSCNTRAPEQSAAWIQGISDPAQQRRLYHRMLGEWAKNDAASVKQWVAANDVPDDVRRRFNR